MRLLVFNLSTDADDAVLGFTTDWVNALARGCEHVSVISMRVGRVDVAKNVDVYGVGKEKGWSRLRRAREFYRLLGKILREQKIDACFAHMIHVFPVMAWPLLKPRRIPIVLWYAHGHVPWLLRLATLLVDRVVTSSADGFRIATPKCRVIGQGIDTQRFKPGNGEAIRATATLLTVGRISPVKHLEALIELVARLPDRAADGRRIVARVVGDPLTPRDRRYADELRDLVGRLGVGERVEFLPAIAFREVRDVYLQADVFLSHSQTGSMDKALLEAMSCGLPVLTSNPAYQAAFPEDLRAAHTVPTNDTETWVRRVTPLLGLSPAARTQQGAQSRAFVQQAHSLEVLSTRILDECRTVGRA